MDQNPQKPHQFEFYDYAVGSTNCTFCKGLLWGVYEQGLKCKGCDINVHEGCQTSVVDPCTIQVRIGHTLNDGEKEHVTRRKLAVQQWLLEEQHIPCETPDNAPIIALIGSGGGERAMVGMLGSLLQLGKEGLLDCMMYLSGVSGSTWAMASLYKGTNWSSKLKHVTEEIVQRLGAGRVFAREDREIKEKYKLNDNCTLTHSWAAHCVSAYVKEIDERVLSDQRGLHGMDPYPIYTVIDLEIRDKNNEKQTGLKDTWFEMTLHEAGYSLTGAFVDQRFFGSKFDNGKLIKEQPEMDMLYVQGLCGSAPADLPITNLFTWGTTYNFLHNMRAEEVDPAILTSEKRNYIDAGGLLNSPYFSVLRPARKIDLIISLDFSQGDPMMTIEGAHRMAKEMGIPFPEVKVEEKDRKEPEDFYVFPGDRSTTPTVIHMPLFNKVNCPDDLDKVRNTFKTEQGALDSTQIKELMKRATANVINNKDNLKKAIKKAVMRRMAKPIEPIESID